jgi:hypothetical protein
VRLRDAPVARRSEYCLNCSAPTPDNFCSHCGQRNTHYRVSTWALLGEAASELFQLDSRFFSTVGTLLGRPGRLTSEYVAGRRMSYSSPLRVYLATSLLYFVTLSLLPWSGDDDKPPPPKVTKSDSVIKIDGDENNPWAQRLKSRVEAFSNPTQIDGKERFLQALVAHIPTALFVLVPVFALILKLAYIRRRRYYSEHLVFALHVHSFAFVALLAATLTRQVWAIFVALAATMVYLFVAQRSVYGQGRFKTFLKWSIVLFNYFWALVVGLALAALLAFALG